MKTESLTGNDLLTYLCFIVSLAGAILALEFKPVLLNVIAANSLLFEVILIMLKSVSKQRMNRLGIPG